MTAPTLLVDMGAESAQILRGEVFVELPLERQADGTLTEATRERVIATLREQGHASGGLFQPRALCAVSARGLSLRRLTLPGAPKEKLGDLVRLQVENEFPAAPEELAWGWRIVGTLPGPTGKQHDVVIGAVRRAAVEEAVGIFRAAGVSVSFTPAPLARLAALAPPEGECALLELGRRESEWLVYEKGGPMSVRALGWGSENLGDAMLPAAPGQKVFLTGRSGNAPAVISRLAELMGVEPKPLLPFAGAERSSALMGLQRLAGGGGEPALRLNLGDTPAERGFQWPREWAALAAALALAALFFPLIEPILCKPHLTRRLAEIHAQEGRLGTLDRELSFFQYLRKSEPPTLELFHLVSEAAAPGTMFDSYTLSRRGELALRGKMGNGADVTDFRSKLMASGWFSAVVVEEQTQQPDRRVNVRLTAQLKPADLRPARPSAPAENKPKPPSP